MLLGAYAACSLRRVNPTSGCNCSAIGQKPRPYTEKACLSPKISIVSVSNLRPPANEPAVGPNPCA